MQIDFGLIDLTLVAPALALFITSCIPLLIKVLRGNKEQNTFATLIYAYMGLVVAAGFALFTMGTEKTRLTAPWSSTAFLHSRPF